MGGHETVLKLVKKKKEVYIVLILEQFNAFLLEVHPLRINWLSVNY